MSVGILRKSADGQARKHAATGEEMPGGMTAVLTNATDFNRANHARNRREDDAAAQARHDRPSAWARGNGRK